MSTATHAQARQVSQAERRNVRPVDGMDGAHERARTSRRDDDLGWNESPTTEKSMTRKNQLKLFTVVVARGSTFTIPYPQPCRKPIGRSVAHWQATKTVSMATRAYEGLSPSERKALKAVQLRRELIRWDMYQLPYEAMATLIHRHWHQVHVMRKRYGLKPRYRREDESFVRQRVERMEVVHIKLAA